ncbi:hypothetical protein [Mesorhizobium sp. 1B3]|uniref:hypothetical protein n=1 Tax=Mesorhizobium sp. 1B3 TaxID=3243599 RepID=UPI003D997669
MRRGGQVFDLRRRLVDDDELIAGKGPTASIYGQTQYSRTPPRLQAARYRERRGRSNLRHQECEEIVGWSKKPKITLLRAKE